MRAAVLSEAGKLVVKEIPRPKAGPGDILLRTRSCGLCGSDLYKIRNRTASPGTVLGHEVVATVIDCPSAYSDRFPPRARVTVSNHIPCGRCRKCRRGKISMCEQFQSTHVDPGGLAEFIRVPATHVPGGLFRLPENVSDEDALIVEPLGCCLRAMDRWRPQASDRILVFGLGTVGLLMVILLSWMGARPIGVDPLEHRRKMAIEKGSVRAVSPDAVSFLEPAQGVILTVCDACTLGSALGKVEPGGWIGLFAGPSEDMTLPCRIQSLYRNEIDLIPSYSTGPAHMNKSLSLLESGAIDVSGLTTHDLPIEEIQRAVELAVDHKGIKAVIRF